MAYNLHPNLLRWIKGGSSNRRGVKSDEEESFNFKFKLTECFKLSYKRTIDRIWLVQASLEFYLKHLDIG